MTLTANTLSGLSTCTALQTFPYLPLPRMFSSSMYFSYFPLLSTKVIIFTFSTDPCIAICLWGRTKRIIIYIYCAITVSYSLFRVDMGTYLCQEEITREKQVSRHINEPLIKSTNISVLKPNYTVGHLYFPCQYLGRGIYGTSIEVFLKEKKQERMVQKIMKTDWLIEQYLFLQTTLFQQLNSSQKFVFTKSIRGDGLKLIILSQKLDYGSLYNFMKKHPKEFDYYHIKELTMRIILLLERLHNKRIIYRSLRPENILFTHDTEDFKLSELPLSVMGQELKHFIGPATYTPPEVYADQTYNSSVDFWMLGVMLYELTFGQTPFEGPNLAQIRENVVNFHSDSIKFSEEMPVVEDLTHFISLLLNPDPNSRPTLDEIRRHRFFHGQRWDSDREEQHIIKVRTNIKNQQKAYPTRIMFCNIERSGAERQFQEHIYEQKLLTDSP